MNETDRNGDGVSESNTKKKAKEQAGAGEIDDTNKNFTLTKLFLLVSFVNIKQHYTGRSIVNHNVNLLAHIMFLFSEISIILNASVSCVGIV